MATLGVNVDPGGNSKPATLDFMRSSWVRAVARPEHDITRWLADASEGQNILMVIAHESADGAGLPWDEALQAWRNKYGPYVSAWQLMNEPDAGWDPVERLSAAQRAASGLYPSSWCMEPDDVSERLRVGRNVLGHDAFIVSPGFSSGHVEFAELCDLSPCNAIACHPYAKTPGSPELDYMLQSYKDLCRW